MNRISWGIIIVLAGIIIYLQECRKPVCPPASVTVRSDTVWLPGSIRVDTVYKPYPVEKIVQGKPYPVDRWDTIWLPLEDKVIDSLAIVRDYFVTRHYRDTLRSDSSSVVIDEKVNQNKLLDRQLTFNIRERQITNTNAIPPRNELYGGLDFGGSAGFAAGGLQLIWKTKADNMYHFGADFTTQGSFLFHGGVDWKLSIKSPFK